MSESTISKVVGAIFLAALFIIVLPVVYVTTPGSTHHGTVASADCNTGFDAASSVVMHYDDGSRQGYTVRYETCVMFLANVGHDATVTDAAFVYGRMVSFTFDR